MKSSDGGWTKEAGAPPSSISGGCMMVVSAAWGRVGVYMKERGESVRSASV